MDISNIKWQRGVFHKFYALMKIRVGAADPKSIPIDIQEGDEFEYDGQLLKYAGSEIHSPQLRGAIKNGWATFEAPDDTGGRVAAVQPNRSIAKAQTVNRDLSRVQRGSNGPIDTDSLDEETVLNVSDRRDASKNPRATPQVLKSENNRRASTAGMRVENGPHEDQDAVTVGRVRSPAKVVVKNILDDRSSGVISDIENRGLGRPEIYKTVEREGVKVRTNVGNVDRSVQIDHDDGDSVVGSVRHSKSSTDGIDVRDTSNIRNKTAVSKATPSKASSSQAINTSLSPRIRAARRIDPSFPSDWSFTGRLVERLDAAKKHGVTPEFLEALYSAEGDQMRKLLEKTYPKQFGQ